MNVQIEYCVVWNYLPRAAGLAAAIKGEIGVEPELIRGRGGVFNVTVGNELIYSKHDTGRFPSEEEILEKLRTRTA